MLALFASQRTRIEVPVCVRQTKKFVIGQASNPHCSLSPIYSKRAERYDIGSYLNIKTLKPEAVTVDTNSIISHQ